MISERIPTWLWQAGAALSCAQAAAVSLALALGAVPAPALAQASTKPPSAGLGFKASEPTRWNGWLQVDAAYGWQSPGHFQNLRTMAELAGRGAWENGAKWKLSAQASLDAAYGISDHYLPGVRRDQRAELRLREAYVDFGAGSWEFRLGKQNIVWGEMVGLFFADVVSAKDLRSFVLPEFEQIRIPQWAARAEWFGDDTHLELVWLPAPEVDRIGEPGAEFFPWPPQYQGYGYSILGEQRPSRSLSNSGIGARVSTLVSGWDLTAFVYRAPDTQAAFNRSLVPGATPADPQTVVYQARYDKVTRIGGTVSKDFDGIVAKAEIVHTSGRKFGLLALDAGSGLTELDTIDWAASVDFTPADDWRVNAQFYQRAFLDHDSRTGLDRRENGISLLVAHALTGRLDAEFLGITSLNRSDRLLRAMLTWKPDANRRIRAGVDVFAGQPLGLFGRFDNSDRLWAEYRYSF